MGFHHRAIRHDLGLGLRTKTTGAQEGARRQADKAVAAKALTAHHRLQQKTVLAIALGVGQLQIEREWGFEVGKRLGHQRNAVVALAGQAFEFKFCNHRAGFPVGATHCAGIVCGRRCDSFKPSAAVADEGAPHLGGRDQTVMAIGLRQGQAPRSAQPVMNT